MKLLILILSASLIAGCCTCEEGLNKPKYPKPKHATTGKTHWVKDRR